MNLFRLVCIGFLLGVPLAVSCQEAGDVAAPPGSGADSPSGADLKSIVDASAYVLGPGDSLLVSLTGVASYVYPTVVTPEGKLFLMMPVSDMNLTPSAAIPTYDAQPVARVQVSGMSIADAQAEANEVAAQYFRNTEIILTLLAFRKVRVSVVGDVLRPGIYTATSANRVSDVLVQAQLRGTASRSEIKVINMGAVRCSVNLYDFEMAGNYAANPYLRDGDVVRVPSMEKRVTVRGAVYGSGIYTLRVSELTAEQTRISEGIYELEDGDRVSDIIRKAGGVLPWANLETSYVERLSSGEDSARKIGIDLEQVLLYGDAGTDIEMSDGDILVIPTLEDVVYVEGAVTIPGAVPYQPGLDLMGYIGLAGGPTERASMGRIRVRTSGGRVVSAKENPEVKRGDTVEVPRVSIKWWEDYVLIGSAVTSVLIAWLSITQ
jgi:protein involved in polysaccharide export with SLBB domain